MQRFRLSRRHLLGMIRAIAAASLVGCIGRKADGDAIAQTTTQTTSQTVNQPGCIVRPQQTEGPYFVDERLNRSDIRSNPADGTVKEGVPLRLVFQVSQVGASACTPLSDATVDVWHCDAQGVYSDVQDRAADTRGQQFLRGYQVTNANGGAEFLTIYPGWYPGRTTHIHFKIRTAAGYEFTSQLYFDDAVSDRVYTQAPYSTKGQRNQTNAQDGIFRNGGDRLLLTLTEGENGYVGRFEIGLEMA
ncbi:intradiol ring-cleavage dioxygenase [Microcoleus sp. FACHB-1515]|uniref:intradiol ring-cleavage dioxygenase n=1 Tax=Cyanophyceae TaxID=3028117 RepID=UPI0016887728|nr:intradiol ring-cleavage dioxygenase [Microcoleus sp. FACHB-1515]MBD2091904.1 intradiol ring-cleavage dioxygenase [Microcoleus sp. FACHB-1515]